MLIPVITTAINTINRANIFFYFFFLNKSVINEPIQSNTINITIPIVKKNVNIPAHSFLKNVFNLSNICFLFR